MIPYASQSWNAAAWLADHSAERTHPILDKAIAGLREQGVTEFAATGYCFGARYCFDLAFDVVKVVAIARPSLLESPEDLQKYASTATAPLLINSRAFDPLFNEQAQAQADAILGKGKFAPGNQRAHWEGCTHGFAVKGDLSDPKVKAGKEGAFKSTVEWVTRYL